MKFSGLFARSASGPRNLRKLAGRCVIRMLAGLCVLVQNLSGSTGVDFRQAADNDAGFGLGNIHWVSSIIQDNNSAYYESMSVMQRLLFTGVPTTSGNHHSLL